MIIEEESNIKNKKNKDKDKEVPLCLYIIASARNIGYHLLLYLSLRATIFSLLYKNGWPTSYRNLMSIYMYIFLVLFILGMIAS